MLKDALEDVFYFGEKAGESIGGAEVVCLILLGVLFVCFTVFFTLAACKRPPKRIEDLSLEIGRSYGLVRGFGVSAGIIGLLAAAAALGDYYGARQTFVSKRGLLVFFVTFITVGLLLTGAMFLIAGSNNKRFASRLKIARLAEERRLFSLKAEQRPAEKRVAETVFYGTDGRACAPAPESTYAAPKYERCPVPDCFLFDAKRQAPVEEPIVPRPLKKEPPAPEFPQKLGDGYGFSENYEPSPVFARAAASGISREKIEELLDRALALPLTDGDVLHLRKIELALRDALRGEGSARTVSSLVAALIKMIAKYDTVAVTA